jgi:4-hydroxy-3-methylbut-2-en-1-yl diphosphate reductase
MSRWVRNAGPAVAHSVRVDVRELQAAGVSVRRGEVLVPTYVGDDVLGLLTCAAAPLIAGSLQRKGCQTRLAGVPGTAEPLADGDAVLYLATCPQQDGSTAAIAAAAAHDDKLGAAHAQSAVEEWAAVADTRMLLAASRPWCTGALQAAAACRTAAAEHAGDGRTVRLYEPEALSPEVATELAGLGAVPVTALADAQPGDIVVFPAHGVRPEVRSEAAERGLTVIDATCPVIVRAQETAARLASRSQQLVLIGNRAAAAAGPISGSAAGHVTVVETPSGTAAMQVPDAQRISYMLQPGLPVEAAEGIVGALRSRYPAARSTQPDGLCYAASDRAATVHAVAAGSDLLLVLGDPESPDARQLAGQAREAGAKVQLIGAVTDITAAMLAGVTTVATAESISAPAALAREVIAAISGLGRTSVARRHVSTEVADASN